MKYVLLVQLYREIQDKCLRNLRENYRELDKFQKNLDDPFQLSSSKYFVECLHKSIDFARNPATSFIIPITDIDEFFITSIKNTTKRPIHPPLFSSTRITLNTDDKPHKSSHSCYLSQPASIYLASFVSLNEISKRCGVLGFVVFSTKSRVKIALPLEAEQNKSNYQLLSRAGRASNSFDPFFHPHPCQVKSSALDGRTVEKSNVAPSEERRFCWFPSSGCFLMVRVCERYIG